MTVFHEVKKYLISQYLDFKMLLTTDNASGNPSALVELYLNFEVVFLPPNITLLWHKK